MTNPQFAGHPFGTTVTAETLELGVTGTLRASFAPYNTKSDVDALVNAVDRALELLVD